MGHEGETSGRGMDAELSGEDKDRKVANDFKTGLDRGWKIVGMIDEEIQKGHIKEAFSLIREGEAVYATASYIGGGENLSNEQRKIIGEDRIESLFDGLRRELNRRASEMGERIEQLEKMMEAMRELDRLDEMTIGRIPRRDNAEEYER